MEFIKRSLTGNFDYYKSFTGLRVIRIDYNPNQPRDARGRFAGGGGSGGGGGRSGKKSGGGGLAAKKVSDLQEIAKKEGIDINKLSYKSRRSVLVSAIEAQRKGKSLREAGLLKATNTAQLRAKTGEGKPRVSRAKVIEKAPIETTASKPKSGDIIKKPVFKNALQSEAKRIEKNPRKAGQLAVDAEAIAKAPDGRSRKALEDRLRRKYGANHLKKIDRLLSISKEKAT